MAFLKKCVEKETWPEVGGRRRCPSKGLGGKGGGEDRSWGRVVGGRRKITVFFKKKFLSNIIVTTAFRGKNILQKFFCNQIFEK